MQKKYILVIGSNSFSGSSFIDFALKKNFNIIGISRSKQPNTLFLKYKNNKNYNKFKFLKQI